MAIVPNLIYQYTPGGATVKVYVRCIDDTTGSNVNGNLTVVYNQVLAGTDTGSHTIYVPGQSALIFFGTNDPGNSWTITSYTTPLVPPVPVGSCDLAIDSIIINNPESSIGANDASITVVASSSYGPIQYSLDNITFQDSQSFNGLSGGLKTIYVIDSNPIGCINSRSFTISTLTSLLVSDPGVTLGNNVSRWNAAFNPIVFAYQRKDFEVNSAALYNVGGITGTTLVINGDMGILVALAAANVIAGANATPFYIYVNTGAYKGVYSVIAATTNSVTINATFTVTSTGFINSDNIRPYYKIITQIQIVDPVTGQASTVQSLNRSNQAGQVQANLSSYLQSLLKAVSKSDYTQVNYRDDDLSASYRIAYAQSWDDGTDAGHTSDFIQLPNTYYVTYTARQLGQKYGGNMAEFVPFPTLAAKWVTDFLMPAYSLSFPFDLGFIYSEALAGLQLYYKITPLDINKNPIISQSSLTGFLLNEDGSYLLNTDGSRLIISETILANTPIVEHIGLNRLLIDFGFDDEVYYFKVGIYFSGATPAGFLYSINNSPYIPGILTPNSATIGAGDAYTIKAYGTSPVIGSKWNWSLFEDPTPYIDGNLQVKVNGVYPPAAVDAFGNSSGSFNTEYNDSVQINAYGTASTTASNPKQNLVIIKDGVTIFSKTIPYVAGPTNGILKTITGGVGRVYSIQAYTTDGTADLPNIDTDTPDRADIKLIVTKDNVVIFQNKIPYVVGILNGLSKSGTAKSGSTYQATMVTGINLADVTPIDITDENPADNSEKQVLNDQIVRIDKNCDQNSVYLRWIGLTGSWNYYRFFFNQEVTLDVQNATIIQHYVTDWENQESIEDVIVKTAGQKMQVHSEDMSIEDIRGCQSMKFSPKVQMLVSTSPIKWQTIVVNTATFAEYDTNSPTNQFAVTFNMPSINIQSQ